MINFIDFSDILTSIIWLIIGAAELFDWDRKSFVIVVAVLIILLEKIGKRNYMLQLKLLENKGGVK